MNYHARAVELLVSLRGGHAPWEVERVAAALREAHAAGRAEVWEQAAALAEHVGDGEPPGTEHEASRQRGIAATGRFIANLFRREMEAEAAALAERHDA